MMTYQNEKHDEERALYGLKDAVIQNCCFDGPADGESAIKECSNIQVEDCFFNLRYPFWHVNHARIYNCKMTDLCRAALWYDEDVTIENCEMNGIKALRECKNIRLDNVKAVSPEFLWRCDGIDITDTEITSEYPLFECRNISISGLKLKGKYSFQYVENMVIRNSELDTKDAFWHSKNVTVTDSVVKGEYLGWYSENLRFVRCRIIGTQPLCYCKNLVLEDCTMEDTDLSFERSEVRATIQGRIEGIKNPYCGKIVADEIGDILMEREYVDPDKTQIIQKKFEAEGSCLRK